MQLFDAGMLAILVVAPLCMGGRHPLGEFVFVSLVAFLTSLWLMGQCLIDRAKYTCSGVEGLLIAGVVLVGAQLISVPQSLLAIVSPGLADALPLWSSGPATVAESSWNTISIAPHRNHVWTVIIHRIRNALHSPCSKIAINRRCRTDVETCRHCNAQYGGRRSGPILLWQRSISMGLRSPVPRQFQHGNGNIPEPKSLRSLYVAGDWSSDLVGLEKLPDDFDARASAKSNSMEPATNGSGRRTTTNFLCCLSRWACAESPYSSHCHVRASLSSLEHRWFVP